MAFITQGSTFYSFADYDDVVAKDSRLFSANEGLTHLRLTKLATKG